MFGTDEAGIEVAVVTNDLLTQEDADRLMQRISGQLSASLAWRLAAVPTQQSEKIRR